jgi:hypothetical protein
MEFLPEEDWLDASGLLSYPIYGHELIARVYQGERHSATAISVITTNYQTSPINDE